ncbi:MAG: class I SAM-dependent methyltransferase [Saprospiraceae bacterium]
MKEFWDKRYGEKEMAYGEEPNNFFATQISKLQTGNLLLPAEGEGRNAIYSAKLGWDVYAFDISIEGKIKAELMALKSNVVIDYKVGGFDKVIYEKNSFDCIGLIFAHFPKHLKSEYHKRLDVYLKKDGIVILEGFSKKQLEYNSKNPKAGGPKNVDMLFSIEEIKQDFGNYEIIELSENEIILNEGAYHNGKESYFGSSRKISSEREMELK